MLSMEAMCVGGIALQRFGANTLDVISNVKARIPLTIRATGGLVTLYLPEALFDEAEVSAAKGISPVPVKRGWI